MDPIQIVFFLPFSQNQMRIIVGYKINFWLLTTQ
jgi:hypothetical protein